ncbi:MAG: MFS transporter [Planctomycetaceae bacterium]
MKTEHADSSPAFSGSAVSNRGKWMALIAALLGWMFDGFEIGMFPVAGRPALQELLKGEPIDVWFGVIMTVYLIGAASGGVLFGWLGDRIGRVRAMSLSIFTYAIFTGLCGFATEAWHIGVLRFIASLGMGGEWSLGVALVNELWPQRSRAFLAGLIGAAANVGIAMVSVVSISLDKLTRSLRVLMTDVGLPSGMTESLLANDAWRLLLIAGALPALLIFFIRLMVPESPKWEEGKRRGATTHFAARDLLGALLGMFAACAVIAVWSPLVPASVLLRVVVTPLGLLAAAWGFLFPIQMFLRRSVADGSFTAKERRAVIGHLLLGAGLSGVALMGTWGSLQWAGKWAGDLTEGTAVRNAVETTQFWGAVGAVFGTILAALTADLIGRRKTYTLLCLGSMLSLLAMYQLNDGYGTFFLATVFIAGGWTAAFYGWFPLYLPELFRTSIRATSQGFAYNFGRVLAAIGALQTAQVIKLFDGDFPKAGSVLCAIYLIGVVLVWFGPETKGRPLPD